MKKCIDFFFNYFDLNVGMLFHEYVTESKTEYFKYISSMSKEFFLTIFSNVDGRYFNKSSNLTTSTR